MRGMPKRGPVANAELLAFYFFGRDDAEEDFDKDDFAVESLATKILEQGFDDFSILNDAVSALLTADDFDGDLDSWLEEYEEELDGVDPKEARRLWRRGFVDETALELQDLVIDEMADMVANDEDDDEEDDDDAPTAGTKKPPKKNAGPYAAIGRDGDKDAVNAWDLDVMEEPIKAAKDDVRASGWVTKADRKQAIRAASKKAAETFQADMDADGAKKEWLEQNADDLLADDLNPEVAYDKWWRPAFVARTAKMIEDELEGTEF